MGSVPGLNEAIRLCDSDTTTQRKQGRKSLEEIFSNRQNIELFGARAAQNNGAGWVQLFQVLFNGVLTEKRATAAKKGGAAAVQRYSEAVNLVRFVAERSCRLLSRKPFMSLFTHLTTLLAGDRRIDDRIAVPYIKALRTLLSFPPHLENLDPTGWRMIMGVCFMALLGDPISLDDEAWGEDLEMDVDDDGQQGYQLASSISTELLSLVPILLSSTRAPLIPDPPAVDDTRVSPPALGCSILFKLSRYIRQLPVQNISIDAIRSINLVLAELEINSKKDFTLASLQLFPQLVMVWTSRSDLAIRETTLVALRTMLPYVTHESVTDESKEAVRDAMSKLVDSIAKEGRSGIRPLDLAALRLDSRPNPAKGPFQLTGVTAGFGFDASQALSWAAIELYADCCRETSTRPTFSVTQRRKRPRTEGSVDKLLDLITSIGEQRHTRLLASQVVVFLVGKHWATLTESRMDLRRKLLELLEEKNVEIQSWGFIGLSCLATVDDSLQEQSRNKLWTHAVRKAAVEGVSRAACHAANVLLNSGKIDHAQSVKSIKAALSDVQGPTSITDASCAFLASCLATMRADVGLYSANFEDKVLDWFDEAFKGETAIKSRIGSATPSNKLDLINAICNFTGSGIADVSVTEHLPESPVVTRILQESETAPIRDVILHGIFPALPETLERQAADPSSSQAETIESLDMLGSRPKKLSKTLQNAVRAVHAELTASDRPTHLMTSERLRKGIDLVVLVLAFEATIQSNGYQSDPAVCLEPAAKLLQLLVKHLNVLDKVPQQLLVWRGFPPIYFKPTMHSAKWPILLKPDVASGIRRDILSPTKYSSHYDEEEVSANSPRDKLLAIIWGREETQAALEGVVEKGKNVLEGICADALSGDTLNAMDDDDFGHINTADGNMSQSSETQDAHRSTNLLLKTLVDLRVRGQLLKSPNRRPVKDIPLLNTLLTSEGSRFIQLGLAICDAVMAGSLRLTTDAVALILEQLWDKTASYLFSRNGELIRLVVVFLTRSLGLWLSPDSDLTANVMELVQGLINRAETGKITYWPARLQLLMFIDEYLDYEPSYNAWMDFPPQEDSIYGAEWGPLSYVLQATGDIDSRVRFRAMSSAAAVHYLPDLSADMKHKAYFNVLANQSSITSNWDHYLTNLLWKLNTCLATAQLRSATMFHLYEVADFDPTFLIFLQPGLEAVARRLGLGSLKVLFTPHANTIVQSQLQSGQSPLGLQFTLYGCSSQQEFAQLCIETVGANLLAHYTEDWALPFFSEICQTALVAEDQARERHLPFAAAIAVADAVSEVEGPTFEMVCKLGSEVLTGLPPPNEHEGIKTLLASRIEYIVASLISVTDLTTSNARLAQILNTVDEGTQPGDTFTRLMAFDTESQDSHPVLPPAFSDNVILMCHSFFHKQFKNMAKRRMVFEGIVQLFFALNSAYLVDEQRRYLRAVAILVSLYTEEFSYSTVLQQFLSNVVALLTQADIAGVAMSMLEWGFDQVPNCQKRKPDLVDILINLSSARSKIKNVAYLKPVGDRLDQWVTTKAELWVREPAIEEALNSAIVFWPAEWAANFPHTLDLATVSTIAERPNIANPMALSRQLNKMIDGKEQVQKETFVTSTFWFLKKDLISSQWDTDGAMALLDLVYKASGEVHAPSLQAIRGLTGRSQLLEHARKYAKVPDLGLRVLVMGRLVEQSTTDDYRLRTITFEVLQATLPIVKSMIELAPAAVPNVLRDLIVYLVPNTSAPSVQAVDLEVLTDGISGPQWVLKSQERRTWAKELALMLSALAAKDDSFYTCLRPLLSSESNAAIELLPYLVQAVLTCGAVNHPDETLKNAGLLTQHFTQVLAAKETATETLETIINIILHLRHFHPPYRSGELAYNHWLSIDPIVLSEAAGKCGAYASSLLFLEMAKDRDDVGDADLNLSQKRIQEIMYDIYSNVEDPDGFYGIQNDDIMDSLLRRLDHEGQPAKSLGYNLANYEATATGSIGASPALVPSVRSLHDLGYHSFAGNFIKATRRQGATDSNSDPFFLELAWRMGDWDVPITKELADTTPGRFYTALRAVHRERDRDVARRIVDDTIHHEMTRLQQIGMERMTEIKAATISLLCLRDVAKWVSPSVQTAIDQCEFDGPLLRQFVDMDASFEFANAERLSATRVSLIQSARERENKNVIGDLLSNQSEGLVKLEIASQLRLSELARKEGDLQAAVNAVTAVRQLELPDQVSDEAQDEFSQVLWAQGHHSLAIRHITNIAKGLQDGRRRALLLGRSAHWTALAKLAAAQDIQHTFRNSRDMGSNHGLEPRERAQLAHEFASWADSYYTTLSKSPVLERLRKKDEIRNGGSRAGSPVVELEEERKHKEALEQGLLDYLIHALDNYAEALSLCDDYDDSITRLCSLWLAHDTDEQANKKFEKRLKRIGTHKFIVLAPQLAARLFRPKQRTAFNDLLNNLMLRLGQEHPYHVLYQIITLAAAAPPLSASSRSKPASSSSSDSRSAAASEILEYLRSDKAHPLASEASVKMREFAAASVNWAQYCHDHKDGTKVGADIQVPQTCDLRYRCHDVPIPIATVIPAIDLSGEYRNLPTIQRYRSVYRVAGGIHRPAIMTVVDTLGSYHVQLFKAEDEVRQDAVMEQVFDMTNRLLSRDRKASLRDLRFRTYTVVPLYNKTGIIEFVGNTTAIGDWLKDAHKRYRKGVDVPAEDIRGSLGKVQEKNHMSDKLVEIFEEKMKRFQPVMRHFFTERHREPLAWFSMRLSYARSVAVTSIVGYMVGLGDRHCSNILIDKVTGELVHIDFGIVFEEGNKLRIPEKVPFRLTKDIVDGLGITDVDGTFRQCAEHTLRVLRDSSDLILTVLDVFKHDPLYAWTGDPSKMRRAQGGGRLDATTAVAAAQAHGQDKAESVLMRIRQKLGRELSVEYQVNHLIQEARDTKHLAKIYIGWQPWL